MEVEVLDKSKRLHLGKSDGTYFEKFWKEFQNTLTVCLLYLRLRWSKLKVFIHCPYSNSTWVPSNFGADCLCCFEVTLKFSFNSWVGYIIEGKILWYYKPCIPSFTDRKVLRLLVPIQKSIWRSRNFVFLAASFTDCAN